MCCQESGEREAVVQLFCPKAKSGDPKIRRVRSVYCRVWMNERGVSVAVGSSLLYFIGKLPPGSKLLPHHAIRRW